MNFAELYQLLFIGSILYLTYHGFMFTYRFVRRLRYNIETAYAINNAGRVLFWLSLTIVLAYLI